MQIYKRRINGRSMRRKVNKAVETLCKVAIILILAMFAPAGALAIWGLVFYPYNINLSPKFEVISTAAWLPSLCVVAGIINAGILAIVSGEYKEMRAAIKTYDIVTFMRLRDEDISPLLYTLLIIFDISIVGGFMLVDYRQDFWRGAFMVWTSTYMVTLLYCVIVQLDDPLAGIWFIKNVHSEWMEIDLKQWRKGYYRKRRQEASELYFGLLKTDVLRDEDADCDNIVEAGEVDRVA